MAIGQVTVNNINLNQAEPTAVERLFLFIGQATLQPGAIVPVNTQSDFYKLFGAGTLPDTLTSALLNAASDWNALAVALDDSLTWQTALTKVLKAGYGIEGVIICDPISTSAAVTELNNQALLALNSYEQRLFMLAPCVGINSDEQTWPDYIEAIKPLVAGLVADRVALVPQLHGNNLGILAGRLANSRASIADSPMRVATGALIGIGETPVDKNGDILDMATITQLDGLRFSVPQTYTGYSGWYWADCNLLANETSDYQVIENLRVTDKACRRVYIKLIPLIADRKINRTSEAIAWLTSYLMAPLRQMAQKAIVNGQEFPGEIEPPQAGDIVVQWQSRTEVVIYITVTPLNSPKKITANIMLDLSQYQ